MPEGGRITIETANKWLDDRAAKERDLPPGQYLSLCVTDTGSGMTPDVIARAFDPFFTTKPIGQGTGLGLSMVYGFVRQSGGQVRIYSEVGQGHDDVPLFAAALRQLGREPHHRGRSRRTRADGRDRPGRRRRAERSHAGHGSARRSRLFPDRGCRRPRGPRILESDARIDLLITDVGLPGGMNGRQLADAARITRPGLKVLFITGYAENAIIGNGHLAPGMRVLTKPFVVETLANRIQDMIGDDKGR